MADAADLWSNLEGESEHPSIPHQNAADIPEPARARGRSRGEAGPWRQGWNLTEEEIAFFRKKSVDSREAKLAAMAGNGRPPIHPINTPQLDPASLMPRLPKNGLRSLSLFSGGGGLDLGFDLAGYEHVASYDILTIAGETLRCNRPDWSIFTGPVDGDVTTQDWSAYRGKVDVIHGGPPCQPFSSAGRQLGSSDTRDMFPTYAQAILACQPRAFVAENVAALSQQKFRPYLEKSFFGPLSEQYHITMLELKAEWFGVPQTRTRLFIIGFRSARTRQRFHPPAPTHAFLPAPSSGEPAGGNLFDSIVAPLGGEAALLPAMGVREALGLPDIGYDDLAPTLRSGFTGPRGATSVNSSVSALKLWGKLGIWPNGVAANRLAAHRFVPDNAHFRLAVQDCGIIQGFPETWVFSGPVYKVIGQIGNSVAPPVAYRVAVAIAAALR